MCLCSRRKFYTHSVHRHWKDVPYSAPPRDAQDDVQSTCCAALHFCCLLSACLQRRSLLGRISILAKIQVASGAHIGKQCRRRWRSHRLISSDQNTGIGIFANTCPIIGCGRRRAKRPSMPRRQRV